MKFAWEFGGHTLIHYLYARACVCVLYKLTYRRKEIGSEIVCVFMAAINYRESPFRPHRTKVVSLWCGSAERPPPRSLGRIVGVCVCVCEFSPYVARNIWPNVGDVSELVSCIMQAKCQWQFWLIAGSIEISVALRFWIV